MRHSSEERLRNVLEQYRSLYLELCVYAGDLLNDIDEGTSIVLDKFDKYCKKGLFREPEDAIRRKLYIAVKRGCIDHFRKLKRRKDGFARLAENMEADQEAVSPEAAMDEAEYFTELNLLVAELEPKFRTVIVGYYMEELPVKDLATQLRISESSVYNHLARGVEMLREKIQQRIPETINMFEEFFGS
jgi:RNA polymerase sigma factor (sigma-70 family)